MRMVLEFGRGGMLLFMGTALLVKQKAIVWISVALIVGTGLFPPWSVSNGRVTYPAGCHWLFADDSRPIEVDALRLGAQWGMILMVAIALLVAPPSFDEDARWVRWLRRSWPARFFVALWRYPQVLVPAGWVGVLTSCALLLLSEEIDSVARVLTAVGFRSWGEPAMFVSIAAIFLGVLAPRRY